MDSRPVTIYRPHGLIPGLDSVNDELTRNHGIAVVVVLDTDPKDRSLTWVTMEIRTASIEGDNRVVGDPVPMSAERDTEQLVSDEEIQRRLNAPESEFVDADSVIAPVVTDEMVQAALKIFVCTEKIMFRADWGLMRLALEAALSAKGGEAAT